MLFLLVWNMSIGGSPFTWQWVPVVFLGPKVTVERCFWTYTSIQALRERCRCIYSKLLRNCLPSDGLRAWLNEQDSHCCYLKFREIYAKSSTEYRGCRWCCSLHPYFYVLTTTCWLIWTTLPWPFLFYLYHKWERLNLYGVTYIGDNTRLIKDRNDHCKK